MSPWKLTAYLMTEATRGHQRPPVTLWGNSPRRPARRGRTLAILGKQWQSSTYLILEVVFQAFVLFTMDGTKMLATLVTES